MIGGERLRSYVERGGRWNGTSLFHEVEFGPVTGRRAVFAISAVPASGEITFNMFSALSTRPPRYIAHGQFHLPADNKPVSVRLFVDVLLVQALAEEFYFLLGRVNAGKYQYREYGHFNAGYMMVGTDGDTYCGQYPDASGGRYAYYDAVAGENNPRAKEADARDYLADDAKVQSRLMVQIRERREGIGADADKNARADADGLAGCLPFEADDRPGEHGTENLRPAKRRNIEYSRPNIHAGKIPLPPEFIKLNPASVPF